MRSLEIWLGSYLRGCFRNITQKRSNANPTHIIFCFVDHFEQVAPGRSTVDRERSRMQAWAGGYPKLAARHWDSDGIPPQHTWFYPAEDYRAEYLDDLSRLCRTEDTGRPARPGASAQGSGTPKMGLHR